MPCCPPRLPNWKATPESGAWPPKPSAGTRGPPAPWPKCTEFYDAFFPRLEEAIDYCDKFTLDDLPDDALNLLHMIYSLIMVAMAVEIMHQAVPTDAADAVMIRTDEPVP